MRLTLHTGQPRQHEISAAFLRGDSVTRWLQAIDRLGIDPTAVECYPVADAVGTVSVAGLFIVFNPAHARHPETLLDPYRRISHKLFIPENTELYPAVTEAELVTILLYDRNILHPSIGLAGFDRKDRLALESLLEWRKPESTNWTLAHPGNLSSPTLNTITLKRNKSEDMLFELGSMLDKDGPAIAPGLMAKPASEITDTQKDRWSKALSSIKQFLGKSSENNPSKASDSISKHIEDELRKALSQSGSLDEKRQAEIERLMKLFKENPEEALRRAIPLGQQPPHRGIADKPSSTLPEHSTGFSPEALRRSRKRDTWDIDNLSRQRLENLYREAALREEQNKNYKLAAFIYAYLLSDFYDAARVLELGKHYHEAAILYHDHIKNYHRAAECYAQAGLFNEQSAST